jgi:uncharacterized RDD family membrane protein YckC
MQSPVDLQSARERENKILFAVAAGLGCLVVVCLIAAVFIVGLALVWTLQGSLGPGSSLLPFIGGGLT